ncbi:MAG: PorT family protein [Ferruginibacter sp.]|nr:PorT family protein [Chitinophagaceae bacterium]
MKKLLGLLIIFFISLSSLQAQQTVFGIKAGYNSSSIEVDNGSDYDSKSGLHVGGLAHIHVSKHFAVQPELVFSCQGGERPNSKLKLSYINLPILAQYMVSNGLRLQTGPQVGFLVAAEQKVGDISFDVDDAYDNIDLSWVIGGGYLFSSGIGIDLRYNIGVSDIIDGGNTDAMNRVLQLGLFYQFKNNGKRK